MLAEDARVDVIANNLANVRSAGFRKDFITFRSRLDGAMRGPRPGLALDRTAWDRQAGPVLQTGRPLDVAIRGEGWFQVLRGGRIQYTRAGDFIVDARGRLATADGQGLVLSDNGGPIDLFGVEKFVVDANGDIQGAAGNIGRLGVVDFADPSALVKAGDGLFMKAGSASPRPATGHEVVQGSLEGSGVESVRELTAMIEAQRAYELNAQLLRIQDEMLGRAANDVARFQA
jgi:flagellar basal body rod protein FlgG